jgi:hypothetical protein
MTGTSPSSNVTKKKQLLALLARSVALHVISVLPAGNVDPDGGTQATLAMVQLSVAVGAG